MTGITREKASQVAADFLGGESRYLGTYYKTYAATDTQGREWKFTFDGSILAEKKEHGERVSTDATYKTEMVSPICTYEDIPTIQELVRQLRHKGAFSNNSCGIHIHVEAAAFNARTLRNLVNIFYSKEDLLFSALEVLFLFSGGLTLAYMLKLFVCLFVEKNPLPREVLDRKWRRRGEHYIAPASLGAVACYLLVMVRLGSEPNVTMDAVAAMTRGFLHGHAPDHPVDYFSPVNLEGAGISLAIGVIVYVLVVRLLLVRKKRYFDPIPPGLNLEYGLYRPLLDLLAKTAVVLATLVDRLLPRLLFQALPRWIGRIHQDGVECWEGAVRRLTGGRYAPQPSVEQAADDEHFARYEDAPRRGGGFVQSLAFGLILTGLGMAFALLFILLYGIHV